MPGGNWIGLNLKVAGGKDLRWQRWQQEDSTKVLERFHESRVEKTRMSFGVSAGNAVDAIIWVSVASLLPDPAF
jgi:hypothetical protein